MAQAPLQTTVKVNNRSGTTTNRQRNWAATDGAILDQGLFQLRSIDLHRKNFAAVWAVPQDRWGWRRRDFAGDGLTVGVAGVLASPAFGFAGWAAVDALRVGAG